MRNVYLVFVNRLIGLMTAMVLLLSLACGRPSKLPEEDSALSAQSGPPGYDILREKIFAPKCIGCHSALNSYESTLASGFVVPGSPSTSLIYKSVASGQMPKGGTPLSSQEVSAISDWIAAGAPNVTVGAVPSPLPGVPTNPPATPGTQPPSTPGGISPTFAWLQANVFVPRCVICHGSANAGGGYNIATYNDTITRVVSGNSTGSVLFQRVNNDSMPVGGTALSPEVKQALATWIQNGAKNDAPAGGVGPTPTPVPLPPLEAKFASINANIIQPRCLGCHSDTNAQAGVRLMNYTQVMRYVRAGRSGNSDLYKVVQSNEMPVGGSPLTSAQKTVLRQWIDAGAANN